MCAGFLKPTVNVSQAWDKTRGSIWAIARSNGHSPGPGTSMKTRIKYHSLIICQGLIVSSGLLKNTEVGPRCFWTSVFLVWVGHYS